MNDTQISFLLDENGGLIAERSEDILKIHSKEPSNKKMWFDGMGLLNILYEHQEINKIVFNEHITTAFLVQGVVGGTVYSIPGECDFGNLDDGVIVREGQQSPYEVEVDPLKGRRKILLSAPWHSILVWVEWDNGPLYGLEFECDRYICTTAAIVGNVRCNTFHMRPVHSKAFCKEYYRLIFNHLNIVCTDIVIPKSAMTKPLLQEVLALKNRDEFNELFGCSAMFQHLYVSKEKMF